MVAVNSAVGIVWSPGTAVAVTLMSVFGVCRRHGEAQGRDRHHEAICEIEVERDTFKSFNVAISEIYDICGEKQLCLQPS